MSSQVLDCSLPCYLDQVILTNHVDCHTVLNVNTSRQNVQCGAVSPAVFLHEIKC